MSASRYSARVNLFALAAGAVLLSGCARATGEQIPRDQALAEIRSYIDEFNKAYESNDLDKYWSFYADEMTQFYPQGRLDLPDYKKYWNQHVAEGNRLTKVAIEDLVIHLGPSNDAAVAHYRIYTATDHPDGSKAEEWAQESDVLHRKDGAWKAVHMHYSYPAPAAPSAPAAQTPSPPAGK